MLEHPHHRPGIPLAIAQQRCAQTHPFACLQLVVRKQQPHQLERRRLPFANLEIGIREARHQGRKRPLDAEAAAEVGVIDVVADERQQIDEPPLDPLELRREARHRLGELADALPLEARVVRDDAPRSRARRHERFRERGTGICGTVGEPLVMHQPAAPLLHVAAELHRHVLPRPAAVPAGDREAHGLEVEEGERRGELGERLRQCRLDHHASRGHRAHLPRVDRGQLQVGRQVVQRRVAVGLVLAHLLALDAVQAADVVLRQLRPAPLDEGTVVRARAVVADRHVGQRPLEHAALCRELVRDAEQHALHQRRDVLPDEQVAQIGIAAVRVQVHDLRPFDRQPGAPQHVHLHGDVREVLRLQAVRRLDLDHPVAAWSPLQDVHGGVRLVREKRRFVDRRRSGIALQHLAGACHLVVEFVERQIHEGPSGYVLPGLAADCVPLVEDVAMGGVRHELRRVGLMHAPPQLFVTLQPGEEARLGEAERRAGHIQQ